MEEFLGGNSVKNKGAATELVAMVTLCKETESHAEMALRPIVSSAETFQWSVSLISTEKVQYQISA